MILVLVEKMMAVKQERTRNKLGYTRKRIYIKSLEGQTFPSEWECLFLTPRLMYCLPDHKQYWGWEVFSAWPKMKEKIGDSRESLLSRQDLAWSPSDHLMRSIRMSLLMLLRKQSSRKFHSWLFDEFRKMKKSKVKVGYTVVQGH